MYFKSKYWKYCPRMRFFFVIEISEVCIKFIFIPRESELCSQSCEYINRLEYWQSQEGHCVSLRGAMLSFTKVKVHSQGYMFKIYGTIAKVWT